MRSMWRMMLLAMLAVPVTPAFAQRQACPDTVRRAVLPARVDTVVAEACQRAPDAPRYWLVALAYPMDTAAPGARRLTQIVAVVDGNGGVVARHAATQEEDTVFALDAGALRIDTARYHLAPGVRAFGVVTTSSAPGPSCPERRFGDELTLYVRDGASLRAVFSTHVEVTSAVRGALCAGAAADTIREHAVITLAMGRGRSHGYADIVSTAAVTERRRRRVSQVFRYDGTRYRPGDTAADASLYWERATTRP